MKSDLLFYLGIAVVTCFTGRAIQQGFATPEERVAALKAEEAERTACLPIKKGKVLYEVHMEHCGPCKYMIPVVDSLRLELADKGIALRTVDLKKERAVAWALGARAVPCFVYMEDLKEKGRFVGATDKAQLLSALGIPR